MHTLWNDFAYIYAFALHIHTSFIYWKHVLEFNLCTCKFNLRTYSIQYALLILIVNFYMYVNSILVRISSTPYKILHVFKFSIRTFTWTNFKYALPLFNVNFYIHLNLVYIHACELSLRKCTWTEFKYAFLILTTNFYIYLNSIDVHLCELSSSMQFFYLLWNVTCM